MANITVNITGTGSYSTFYVTINGKKYYKAQTLEITSGTTISCTPAGGGSVTVNGSHAATGKTYNYVPDSSVTVVNIRLTPSGSSGAIAITTESSSGGSGEYTITISGYVNNSACMIMVNDALIPYGTTTYAAESGADIYVETDNNVYVDGVQQSYGIWESTVTSNLLIEHDGLDAYVTTNYSGGGSGGSGGSGGKTLIGGTAYSITGGRVLIGGTAYSIDKGKTMVNGTIYEIAFAPSTITVNITGTGYNNYSYVTINGTNYSSATTLEVEVGTEILAYAWATSGVYKTSAEIELNGSVVATGTRNKAASYTFTPNCSVVDIALSFTSNIGVIAITTS